VLVGEVAKRQAITGPDRTFRSVRRDIGEDWKTETSTASSRRLRRSAHTHVDDAERDVVATWVTRQERHMGGGRQCIRNQVGQIWPAQCPGTNWVGCLVIVWWVGAMFGS
jgi:hypothetical protein